MDGRESGLLSVIMVVALTLGALVGNSGPAAAQGTICGDYSLPQDAQVTQLAGGLDAGGNKIIIIFYSLAGSSSRLAVPFDTIAVTCADPRVRAEVLNYQKFDQEVIASSCKFVGDLLAGRIKLPPDKGAHYNLKYAKEWYLKTCVGTK